MYDFVEYRNLNVRQGRRGFMEILVIGSGGQLGSDCMSVLKNSGTVQGVDFPEMDITDDCRMVEILNQYLPEVIVNCAAYTAVDLCENDPACWKVNADGPRNLAKWACENGAFLVQVSTDYVFDGSKPLFSTYTESEIAAPVSEYGRSKRAGEQAILESGADAAILRTAWLYGRKGNNFLKTMLRMALQNPARELRVVKDQFGSPTWSFTLAHQIATIVEARAPGLFHATSEGYCSWYDLADSFLKEMGFLHPVVACTSAEYPTIAPRPTNSILENKRLKDAGLNVFSDWRKEMESFVAECGESILSEAKERI